MQNQNVEELELGLVELDASNVYFTSDVDAKSRISSLNEFYRINLNDVRRAGAHDDGIFNECMISDPESDDDIASINLKYNDDADDDDD